jgi:amino acid permease
MNVIAVFALNYTIELLIEAKNIGKTASYSGLSYIISGRPSIFILNAMIAIYLNGSVLVYFIIYGDILPTLFNEINSLEGSVLTGIKILHKFFLTYI